MTCKWTNRDGVRVGGDSQGVLFFRVAEFMSVSFLYGLYSFSTSLLSHSGRPWYLFLFFSFLLLRFFFLIILLCGKPNLSEGRSIMSRCNKWLGMF